MSRAPRGAARGGRRRFLRGVGGVLVGLPFLEGLAPKKAIATGNDVAPFAIFVRQGNGVKQLVDNETEEFWPGLTPGVPLTRAAMQADHSNNDRAVSCLFPYAERLNLIKGVGFAFPGNMCFHSGGGNQCLTAAQVSQDALHQANLSLAMGESIDNLIARQLTPGVEPLTLYVGAKLGFIDEVLSYRGPLSLRAAENDPYNVYMSLFGLHSVDPTALEALQTRRKSVNDLVRGELAALRSRSDLSMADQQRLELHFQSIRDLELGLICGLPQSEVDALQANRPFVAADEYFEANAKLMMRLAVLALSCGAVRACTLQLGCGNNGTVFPGMGYSYHKISHRIDSDGLTGTPIANAASLHHQIDKIHASLFLDLLDKLDAVPLTHGSLLDAGVAVWHNDLGDKYHSFTNVPYVLAGSAKGALKTGTYIDVSAQPIMNNLVLNTIGAAVGCTRLAGGSAPLDDFGDPSLTPGRIDAIVA